MAKNPYADAQELANLLWEAEMVADRYSNGGLMFVRAKEGWRAFLGDFDNEGFRNFEKSLERLIPSYEFIIERDPNLNSELINFLIRIGTSRDYYPEKFRYSLEEDLED